MFKKYLQNRTDFEKSLIFVVLDFFLKMPNLTEKSTPVLGYKLKLSPDNKQVMNNSVLRSPSIQYFFFQ